MFKKILITILTSSNINFLKLCYRTALSQQNMISFQYNICIVVNSQNNDYYNTVKDAFIDEPVQVLNSLSNGMPGKGKNACLQIFKQSKDYDYLSIIDGDDFLFPSALRHLESLIINTNLDILLLMCFDNIQQDDLYIGNQQELHFIINNKVKYCYNKQENYLDWLNLHKYYNIYNAVQLNEIKTPGRIGLFSRNSLNFNITYDETTLLDDLLPCLQIMNLHNKNDNSCKIIMTDDPNILLVNKLNKVSATVKLSTKNYRNKFSEFNKLKNQIYMFEQNNWNLHTLEYKTIKNDQLFTLQDKDLFISDLVDKLNLEKYIPIDVEKYKTLLSFHENTSKIKFYIDKYKESIQSLEDF